MDIFLTDSGRCDLPGVFFMAEGGAYFVWVIPETESKRLVELF